jgi:hypothetical protein
LYLLFSFVLLKRKDVLKNIIGNFYQGGANASQSLSSSSSLSSLEPTPEFKEFFLNPNLPALLFKCYELVRGDQDMAHAAMQPIVLLSTLNGPIFRDDHTNASINGAQPLKAQFIDTMMNSFLATFSK